MEFSQAHAIIYNHLLDLHRRDPDFRFLLYPRRGLPYEKLEEEDFLGIDVSGNIGDNMIIVSLLHGNIALNINLDTSMAKIVVTVEISNKRASMVDVVYYFERMANVLHFVHVPKGDLIHNWEKKMLFHTHDLTQIIDDFIEYSHKEIDNYIFREDHDWEWRNYPIVESEFEQNIALNEGITPIFLNEIDKKERDCILKYLKITNYQGIKSLTINSLPNDAQWIFLTGENGFGKTSILKAIVKGLLGDEPILPTIEKGTQIISTIVDNKKIHCHNLQKGKQPKHIPNVLAYGIGRFNLTRDINDYGNTYTLFKDDGYLLSIEKLLETADEPTFEKIKIIFKKIIPNLENIEKVKIGGFYEIRYQEKNSDGDIFDLVKLQDLAAGYRGIIIMIGDMIRRFNPSLEKPFDEVSGIVIIDEFDAHLHPKYQYELPKLLSNIFPKIQFIVSTHSPIPLLGVEPNTAVVLTVNRTKELGITVERLDDDIDIARLSANALLTSDIFGFKSIFARGSTPDTIEPFDDYKDIKEMNELEKRLKLKQGFKDLKIKIA